MPAHLIRLGRSLLLLALPLLTASSSRSPQALPRDLVPATPGAKLGLSALRAQQGWRPELTLRWQWSKGTSERHCDPRLSRRACCSSRRGHGGPVLQREAATALRGKWVSRQARRQKGAPLGWRSRGTAWRWWDRSLEVFWLGNWVWRYLTREGHLLQNSAMLLEIYAWSSPCTQCPCSLHLSSGHWVHYLGLDPITTLLLLVRYNGKTRIEVDRSEGYLLIWMCGQRSCWRNVAGSFKCTEFIPWKEFVHFPRSVQRDRRLPIIYLIQGLTRESSVGSFLTSWWPLLFLLTSMSHKYLLGIYFVLSLQVPTEHRQYKESLWNLCPLKESTFHING